MKKVLFIFLIFCFSLTIISCSDDKEEYSATGTTDNTTTTDTTAPTVTSVSTTADNQSSVSTTDNITVTFSEAMDSTYVTTNTSDTYCSGTLRVSPDNFSTCVRMSSEPISSNSNMTFTLDPVDNLTVGTTYKIRVTTGVRDTAGNALSSQYDNPTGFTPADTTAPTVSSVSTTADNQSSVSITDNITVTFSEAMDNTTVTTNTDNTSCYGTLRVTSDNFSSCVQMSSSSPESSDNITFTLDPSGSLTGGTTYKTRVTTAAKDTAGNALSSQYDNSTGFTTSSSASSNSNSVIAAGLEHSCAILDNSSVKCWGEGKQLGIDSPANKGDDPGEMAALPSINLGTGRTATAIAAGYYHSCAILDNSSVKCWGYNDKGQLGIDNSDNTGNAAGEMNSLLGIDL